MFQNPVVLFMYPHDTLREKKKTSTTYTYTPTCVDVRDLVYITIAMRVGIWADTLISNC